MLAYSTFHFYVNYIYHTSAVVNKTMSEINYVCDCYNNNSFAISGDCYVPNINWQNNNDKYFSAVVICIMANCFGMIVF